MMRKRLPRVLRLPGGFVIHVKQKPLKDEHGYFEYSIKTGVGVIWLNSQDDLSRKWRTWAHEMIHAANDYEHWVTETISRPLEIEMGETLMDLDDDD